MALMKKLEGTKWGANMKMLTQVYTANVRFHMEYASNAWSSAARTNLGQLIKPQNAELGIIKGGMKIIPISEVERTVGLLSLEEKREEKLLHQSEKMKRLSSHPLYFQFEAPTQTDPRHRVQTTWSSTSAETQDPLISMQPTTGNASKLWGLASRNSNHHPRHPRHSAKEHHTDEELRSLALEPLSVAYPSTSWARAYTDGSAEEAAKNGGGGVFVKLPNSRSIRKSVATGQQSTNYKTEAYALLAAALTLNQEERLPTNTVFLTDCWSILQSFQSPGGSLLTVVLEAMRKQTYCQKWEASWSSLYTPCPTVKQRPL